MEEHPYGYRSTLTRPSSAFRRQEQSPRLNIPSTARRNRNAANNLSLPWVGPIHAISRSQSVGTDSYVHHRRRNRALHHQLQLSSINLGSQIPSSTAPYSPPLPLPNTQNVTSVSSALPYRSLPRSFPPHLGRSCSHVDSISSPMLLTTAAMNGYNSNVHIHSPSTPVSTAVSLTPSHHSSMRHNPSSARMPEAELHNSFTITSSAACSVHLVQTSVTQSIPAVTPRTNSELDFDSSIRAALQNLITQVIRSREECRGFYEAMLGNMKNIIQFSQEIRDNLRSIPGKKRQSLFQKRGMEVFVSDPTFCL